MEKFKQFMGNCQQRVEVALSANLPPADQHPKKLYQAIRYSALDGGKRIRPMLVYGAGQAVGTEPALLDSPASAIEMIHVYSLIHDDLPAMDNDDLRRGRPTCHKAFDEATAILAGDALQAQAFTILINDQQIPKTARLGMLKLLGEACGSTGMVGGQAIDLDAEGQQLDLPALEHMHALKTGALIRSAVLLGTCACDTISDAQRSALDDYGRILGLAFQIQDDILDETGDTKKLGKPRGSDRQQNKSTFVSLYGLKTAQQRATHLLDEGLQALTIFDDRADCLRNLARYIVQRDH